MTKHRPHLNVFGRQLLVHRITDENWPVAHVAAAVGVIRATAYMWRAKGERVRSTAAAGHIVHHAT